MVKTLSLQFQEEEDPLNSSLTPMDWLPRLNAKAGMVEVRQYFLSRFCLNIFHQYFRSIFCLNISYQYFASISFINIFFQYFASILPFNMLPQHFSSIYWLNIGACWAKFNFNLLHFVSTETEFWTGPLYYIF